MINPVEIYLEILKRLQNVDLRIVINSGVDSKIDGTSIAFSINNELIGTFSLYGLSRCGLIDCLAILRQSIKDHPLPSINTLLKNKEFDLSGNDEKYKFTITPLSEEDGGGFSIEYPDLPGCMSDGGTIEEAIKNGEDAVICWFDLKRG